MKKSLIAIFYILTMLGSSAAFAADDDQQEQKQKQKQEHASAKYVDAQTLSDDGCG